MAWTNRKNKWEASTYNTPAQNQDKDTVDESLSNSHSKSLTARHDVHHTCSTYPAHAQHSRGNHPHTDGSRFSPLNNAYSRKPHMQHKNVHVRHASHHTHAYMYTRLCMAYGIGTSIYKTNYVTAWEKKESNFS